MVNINVKPPGRCSTAGGVAPEVGPRRDRHDIDQRGGLAEKRSLGANEPEGDGRSRGGNERDQSQNVAAPGRATHGRDARG